MKIFVTTAVYIYRYTLLYFLFVLWLHKAHFVAAGIKTVLSEHIKRRNRNNTLKREWKTENMDKIFLPEKL